MNSDRAQMFTKIFLSDVQIVPSNSRCFSIRQKICQITAKQEQIWKGNRQPKGRTWKCSSQLQTSRSVNIVGFLIRFEKALNRWHNDLTFGFDTFDVLSEYSTSAVTLPAKLHELLWERWKSKPFHWWGRDSFGKTVVWPAAIDGLQPFIDLYTRAKEELTIWAHSFFDPNFHWNELRLGNSSMLPKGHMLVNRVI